MAPYLIRRRGFTILELLTIITIISILLGFALVSYSSSKRNSRDARRKSDVTTYANALQELYSVKNTLYQPSFGASGFYYGRLTYTGKEGPIHYGSKSIAQSLITLGYLASAATDPSSTGNAPGQPDYVFVRCQIISYPIIPKNTQSVTPLNNSDAGGVWTKLENTSAARDVDLSNTRATCGSDTALAQFDFGYDPSGPGMKGPTPGDASFEKNNGYFAASVGRTY